MDFREMHFTFHFLERMIKVYLFKIYLCVGMIVETGSYHGRIDLHVLHSNECFIIGFIGAYAYMYLGNPVWSE